MKAIRVYRLHAFQAEGRGGNPAGVVLDADGLTEPQMQQIAAEVGLSETAFVMRSSHADVKVRFFTPTHEVDLCGHATIAAFSLLFQLGRLELGQWTQETKAGNLAVKITEQGVVMAQAAPQFGQQFDANEIAPLLGLQAEQILATGLPLAVVSTGLSDLMVPIHTPAQLKKIQPDLPAIKAFCKANGMIAFHLFTLTPNESQITAMCRNFAPAVGIDEESATGSACGALGAYLSQYGGLRGRFVFEQGRQLKSPSILQVTVEQTDQQIEQVWVGGDCSEAVASPMLVADELPL
ncbi:putative isomerase YddE [Vibrio stylophorae]|uniref:Isomerase YddE n=1 Tax=Vibrio stylophorae TaxID=659351 RepID=A0ABM8ZY66_9VIBR|nr:PhzF family phenazine biosynthesis protein [Vibrio stylophorae]CAH0535786.1 putative isomerase YddE [Vibrio stylophorae]